MELTELKPRPGIAENARVNKLYLQFKRFLDELRKRKLPEKIIDSLNQEINDINTTSGSGRQLRTVIHAAQTRIIKLLEKELKLVPKNYYRNTWMGIGLAGYGLPLGAVFGMILGNMAFLSLGLPIGMVIGMSQGSNMDKKAFREGRQLDVEIKS